MRYKDNFFSHIQSFIQTNQQIHNPLLQDLFRDHSNSPQSNYIASTAHIFKNHGKKSTSSTFKMSSYQFLTLAPTTSTGYPSAVTKCASKESNVDASIPVVVDSETIDMMKTRRSSSLSSTSSTKKARFLKLGPVHYGSGEGDWSEEVIE